MPLSDREKTILREVVSLPTAPFFEGGVQAFIRKWAAQSGFKLKEDTHGNLLVHSPGKESETGTPWVLQAHMDHPGFCFIRRRGRVAQAWFRGGVLKEYFPGARMRFLPVDGASVPGSVQSVRRDKASGFLRCRIELDEVADLPEGTMGMWDLPAWRCRGDTLSLRVADDLCGVASILLTFERLKRSGCVRPVYGLLTRAEEVGFIGALGAAQSGILDPAWPVLGIEASKAQPNARIGEGAVIRVGDAMTVFDPALTAILRQVSRDLSKQRKTAHCRYVASLMPGGSTESTGLAQMKYRTCAVCLPLGNYHNMGSGKIAPEKISLNDFESLVVLLTAVARRDPDESVDDALRKRLMDNYHRRSPLL